MQPFVAYHGLSGAEHQQRVDTLSRQGYRPISLGVSGDPPLTVYSAVWVQRSGPKWWSLHNLSAAQYQARLDQLVAQGYAPVLVSASGPAATATFAAVFEQGISVPWFARHGLRWGPESDPDTIVHENARALREGFIPRSLAVYGSPGDRRFAGTWFRNLASPTNPARVTNSSAPWSWWFADQGTHQLVFEAEIAGGMRPAWICAAPDQFQLSVFRDDQVGEWWARHAITGDEYQIEFNARVAVGAMPIVVQASGTGNAIRYSSVFARTETPAARLFTLTGRLAAGLSGIDQLVRQFMEAHAIRAGAVAVVRGDEVLVGRGYTWAEPGYPITQPDSRFRIASLAKLLTAAAIARLVATGRLAWNTTAFPCLGVTGTLLSDQNLDPVVDTITIEQLVHHTGGLNHARITQNGTTREFEPADELRTLAARLGRTTTPSRNDVVKYMHGERPDFPPGTQERYSNFGYVLLTSIVEAASGHPYLPFVHHEILAPLGLSDVWNAATGVGGTITREVRYDHPGSGLSVLQPAANVWAPNAYGGAFALENGEGSGGLISTVETMARVISHHAVWGAGGRTPGLRRYGILDGTMAGAASRHDQIDFVYAFNRRVSIEEQEAFTNAFDVHLTRSLSWARTEASDT
jgi:CubicO group peptidase (beta-lactamase class C family)